MPIRNFLGKPGLNELATSCAIHRVAWAWGFSIVLTVGLLYARKFLIDQSRNVNADGAKTTESATVPPLWVCFAPVGLAAGYTVFAQMLAISAAQVEEARFVSSGLGKTEFLSQRSQDDRARFSGIASLCGTAALSIAALFGPFLRADR